MTVAKQVGTAAVLSAGRVALGVGVGWCEEEFVATGQDFHTRGKRLDDMIPALRALWAGGWVEYHGPHYDVPAMRMEPSPPAPSPSSAAATPPRPCAGRPPCATAGWPPGAYKPEQARTYLDELAEQRRRAGRENEPFSIYLSLWARPDADLYRSFEEDYGVTDTLCAPAMVAEGRPVGPPRGAIAGADSTPRPGSPTRSWPRCGDVRHVDDTRHSMTLSPRMRLGTCPRRQQEGPMASLKLGLQLGYWGSGPPPNAPELVAEAERLGFDSVWTAEAYGSDALTPLAWWGSRTTKVRLGTALCQLSARTPTAMAMAALTLDHLCGGRLRPRPGRLGTTGRRRLVRPAVPEAAGAHA